MSDLPVRLPPYSVQRVLRASELADRIDWGQRATGLPDAWKVTRGRAKGGQRVRIAVLDTGVDRAHLDGDLRNVTLMHDATGGQDPHDTDGHGTHCLGTVGACADGRGVIGCAPEAKLLSIKCLTDGAGLASWVARGIDVARDNGAHVISMSLGSPFPDPAIEAALERAVAAGIFVVCAAGNSGPGVGVDYPARWDDTLAVAAVDAEGNLARYSSRGMQVDIAAPGSDVTSTWLAGGYAKISGTSMATPLVAGVVALLIARHWDLGWESKTPLDSLSALQEHLARTARDMDEVGHDDGTGWGLIKADRALATPLADDGPASGVPVSPAFEFGGVRIYQPSQAGHKASVDWDSDAKLSAQARAMEHILDNPQVFQSVMEQAIAKVG